MRGPQESKKGASSPREKVRGESRPAGSRGDSTRNVRRPIAIVSPDEPCRRQIEVALKDSPWDLTFYKDYQQADDRIAHEPVACVILHESRENGDGVRLFRKWQETRGAPRTIFVTTIHRISWGVDLILAGAVYVLEKPVDPDRLVWAISAAVNQSMERRSIEKELDSLRRNRGDLSPRESEVLDRMIEGTYSSGDLARILKLTERTVENYRHSIMRKYGCRKMIEVIGVEHRRLNLESRLRQLSVGEPREERSR